MQWDHDASAEWMKVRRAYLTASDIAGLVPSYERALRNGKGVIPCDVLVPSFAKLWGEKHGDAEIVTRSDGAAARGHIMEPYAVADYVKATGIPMHHWDDCLVCSDDVLAFSPDALDIPQPVDEDGTMPVQVRGEDIHPMRMVEIKSYGIVRHYECMLADKQSLALRDQRVQMAVAMRVCPTIETATLLNYNPTAYAMHSMFAHGYSRDDLKPEMALIDGMASEWKKTCNILSGMDTGMSATVTEFEVWQREMQPKFGF